MRQFLIDDGWLVKLVGAMAVAAGLAWLARRGTPRRQGGWRYARYPLGVRLFMVAFAVFMTGAIAYNGVALFENEWWVPPVIVALTGAVYWMLYEAFVVTIRWSDTELQVFRPPFRAKTIAFTDVVALRHQPAIESVTIRTRDGTRAWLPYGSRGGMPELITRIAQAQAQAERDASATAPPG